MHWLSIAVNMYDLQRTLRSLISVLINSLKCRKMTKYSLVMTPTPCTVAGCIVSIRPTYSLARALTYLYTYLHSWVWAYKTGNISETVEDRAKVTINGHIL